MCPVSLQPQAVFELDVAVKSKSLKIPTIHADASVLPDQKYGVNCLCCELAACPDGSLLGMLTYVAPDLWGICKIR
jgi:hypothetical protein